MPSVLEIVLEDSGELGFVLLHSHSIAMCYTLCTVDNLKNSDAGLRVDVKLEVLLLCETLVNVLINTPVNQEREIRALLKIVDTLNASRHLDIVFKTEVIRVEHHQSGSGKLPSLRASTANQKHRFFFVACLLDKSLPVFCVASDNINMGNAVLVEGLLDRLKFKEMVSDNNKLVVFVGELHHSLPFMTRNYQ